MRTLPTETLTSSPTSPPNSPRRVPLPRVVFPTSKVGQDPPIYTRTLARTPMPAPSTTLKATINLLRNHPVAYHTRSRTPVDDAHMIPPRKSSSRVYPKSSITMLSMRVMNEETGNLLNYRQLHAHPKFFHICNQSYSNEMGCLCQGIRTGVYVTVKRADGTNNFYVI